MQVIQPLLVISCWLTTVVIRKVPEPFDQAALQPADIVPLRACVEGRVGGLPGHVGASVLSPASPCSPALVAALFRAVKQPLCARHCTWC